MMHTHTQHMNNVAASLLVRFFSHFTLRLHGTQCDLHSYGVIMENIFPVESSCIAETYDLKGSTYKRSVVSPTKHSHPSPFAPVQDVMDQKSPKPNTEKRRKRKSGDWTRC